MNRDTAKWKIVTPGDEFFAAVRDAEDGDTIEVLGLPITCETHRSLAPPLGLWLYITPRENSALVRVGQPPCAYCGGEHE